MVNKVGAVFAVSGPKKLNTYSYGNNICLSTSPILKKAKSVLFARKVMATVFGMLKACCWYITWKRAKLLTMLNFWQGLWKKYVFDSKVMVATKPILQTWMIAGTHRWRKCVSLQGLCRKVKEIYVIVFSLINRKLFTPSSCKDNLAARYSNGLDKIVPQMQYLETIKQIVGIRSLSL